VVGDLIDPDDERFHSSRGMFLVMQGVAESCRHAVVDTIPYVPWGQEELPSNLEPFRAALLALPPGQLRRLWRTPELDPTLHAVYHALLEAEGRRSERRNTAWETEELAQCQLAREIIQPPFVTLFAPSWRTSTVLALAREIDQTGAFDRLPTLADALEQAGCADPEILGHCRVPGGHARGCWVVGLGRAKE